MFLTVKGPETPPTHVAALDRTKVASALSPMWAGPSWPSALSPTWCPGEWAGRQGGGSLDPGSLEGHREPCQRGLLRADVWIGLVVLVGTALALHHETEPHAPGASPVGRPGQPVLSQQPRSGQRPLQLEPSALCAATVRGPGWPGPLSVPAACAGALGLRPMAKGQHRRHGQHLTGTLQSPGEDRGVRDTFQGQSGQTWLSHSERMPKAWVSSAPLPMALCPRRRWLPLPVGVSGHTGSCPSACSHRPPFPCPAPA